MASTPPCGAGSAAESAGATTRRPAGRGRLFLARPDVAAGSILEGLQFALARHPRALGRPFLVRLSADPLDPIGPPAALMLGGAGDELLERLRLRLVGPVLV